MAATKRKCCCISSCECCVSDPTLFTAALGSLGVTPCVMDGPCFDDCDEDPAYGRASAYGIFAFSPTYALSRVSKTGTCSVEEVLTFSGSTTISVAVYYVNKITCVTSVLCSTVGITCSLTAVVKRRVISGVCYADYQFDINGTGTHTCCGSKAITVSGNWLVNNVPYSCGADTPGVVITATAFGVGVSDASCVSSPDPTCTVSLS